jgi:hypothetical protein
VPLFLQRHQLIQANLNTSKAVVAERRGPAGVEEQGTFIVGSSRNLGGPVVSVNESGLGIPVNNSQPAAGASCGCGNEAQGASAVPRSEGNEATWEGRQEGGVLRTTYEAGNQPEEPCGGKGAPGHGQVVRGKDGGDTELHKRLNETRANSETGARDAAGGIDHARPSHRHRVVREAYRRTRKEEPRA